LSLPKLYAITDARLSGLSHPQQVEALCAGGAALIQIREKRMSDYDFYHQASEALLVARRYGATLLINDRVDIALAIGADGVHLGQADLPPGAARELLPSGSIIGISTHNIEQLCVALAMPVDYVAFGPIFSTSTKLNPDPAVGVEGLLKARRVAEEFPLVAIGGIQANSAPEVFAAGADSVAMVSCILTEKGQITPRVRQFLAAK